MPGLVWKPNGLLDVATAASDLPEVSGSGVILSEALARCKNLRINRQGLLETRHGTTRLNTTAMSSFASFLIEQAGDRYAFVGGAVYENEASIETGLTAADWSAVLYNAFNDTTQQVFATNGTDRKRIEGSTVYEWGIEAPTAPPVLAAGALTGLTGDYNAKYSYIRKSGSTLVAESNLSPAGAAAVTLANGSLDVTWTASADSQVTHVRVYRTIADGIVYFVDQDVAVGATTVDTNTADASLGAQESATHDRIPIGINQVLGPFYNGVVFGITSNRLYYCSTQQPEYWPTNNYIEVGARQRPLTCLINYLGQAYAFSSKSLWYIQGTGAGVFHPINLRSMSGAFNKFGALGVEGHGIFHIGPDGLYRYSGGKDTKASQERFEPIFHNESVGGIAGASLSDLESAWLHLHRNQLFMHWGTGNVLVTNLDSGRSTYHAYDQKLYAPADDRTNQRMLACDSAGYVRVIDDSGATTDAGTAITWESQSKDFTMQTRRHFPRWAKYDVDASAATGVTGSIILDDAVHQTHTITGARATKRRLIDTGNGRRCAIRVSGSGTASIYTAEMQ